MRSYHEAGLHPKFESCLLVLFDELPRIVLVVNIGEQNAYLYYHDFVCVDDDCGVCRRSKGPDSDSEWYPTLCVSRRSHLPPYKKQSARGLPAYLRDREVISFGVEQIALPLRFLRIEMRIVLSTLFILAAYITAPAEARRVPI